MIGVTLLLASPVFQIVSLKKKKNHLHKQSHRVSPNSDPPIKHYLSLAGAWLGVTESLLEQ